MQEANPTVAPSCIHPATVQSRNPFKTLRHNVIHVSPIDVPPPRPSRAYPSQAIIGDSDAAGTPVEASWANRYALMLVELHRAELRGRVSPFTDGCLSSSECWLSTMRRAAQVAKVRPRRLARSSDTPAPDSSWASGSFRRRLREHGESLQSAGLSAKSFRSQSADTIRSVALPGQKPGLLQRARTGRHAHDTHTTHTHRDTHTRAERTQTHVNVHQRSSRRPVSVCIAIMHFSIAKPAARAVLSLLSLCRAST